MIIKCDNCNKEFFRRTCHVGRYKHQFCSFECKNIFWKLDKNGWLEVNQKRSEANKGNRNGWKGGRLIHRGYVYIYKPEHPFAVSRGYVCEHRLTMEEAIGRYLTKIEVVHHINEITTDNQIENLMLFANTGEHQSYHKQQRDLKCLSTAII